MRDSDITWFISQWLLWWRCLHVINNINFSFNQTIVFATVQPSVHNSMYAKVKQKIKGVALTDVTLLARRAVLPWSYNYTEGGMMSSPARVKPPAGPPWSVTNDDKRQTTTDARKHHKSGSPTLCVSGPVIKKTYK